MKYALVDGIRRESSPNGRAICPNPECARLMIPKCGQKVVWHWAHESRRHCDRWWENETEWHRKWKSCFPENCQEVIHIDDETGEVHIADVKTDQGLVLEFQHSNISLEERNSRDSFYKNIIWVVDISHWKKGIILGKALPPPSSRVAKRIVFQPEEGWSRCDRKTPPLTLSNGGDYFHPKCDGLEGYIFKEGQIEEDVFGGEVKKRDQLKGEIKTIFSTRKFYQDGTQVESHVSKTISKKTGLYMDKIHQEIQKNYLGHHFFHSEREIDVWLNCTKPVYFDNELSDHLLKLSIYGNRTFHCLQLVKKEDFLASLFT